MTRKTTRREMLKESVALAGLGLVGLPEWAFPAIPQEATLVPFTDLPETVTLEPTPERRIIDITGGEVSGPKLSGRILPGGADWQIIRADGVAVLEARYTIEADGGALVYVQNFGYRHGPADVLAQLFQGEDVDPARYYFRGAPVFETSAPALDWLNRTIAVCTGVRTPERVILDFYAVN